MIEQRPDQSGVTVFDEVAKFGRHLLALKMDVSFLSAHWMNANLAMVERNHPVKSQKKGRIWVSHCVGGTS